MTTCSDVYLFHPLGTDEPRPYLVLSRSGSVGVRVMYVLNTK